LKADKGSILGEIGGILDLTQKDIEPPNLYSNFQGESILPFMELVYKLSPKHLRAVKQGDFTSRDALEAIEATIWKSKRSPLKMLLLQLYANYPERGFCVPNIDGVTDYVKLVRQYRNENKRIHWFNFALTLANRGIK
jgi:hypothetical protein